VPLHPQPPLFNARTHVDTKFYDEEVYFHDGDQKVFDDGDHKVFNAGDRNYGPLFPDDTSNFYNGDRNENKEVYFFTDDDPNIDDEKLCSGKEQSHDDGKLDGDNKFCAGKGKLSDREQKSCTEDFSTVVRKKPTTAPTTSEDIGTHRFCNGEQKNCNGDDKMYNDESPSMTTKKFTTKQSFHLKEAYWDCFRVDCQE